MLAAAVGLACADGRHGVTVPEVRLTGDTAALRAPMVATPLVLQTYEGSGQSVHPDFAAPTNPWKRRLFYLALTPYPGGSPLYENPSLYASLDGVTWGAAPHAPMPLVRPVQGHLSDPDLVYASARNELFLYYRQSSDSDRVLMLRSVDGAAWSEPRPMLAAPAGRLLSPAVVRRRTGTWLMWSVDARTGCRDEATTVELRRSNDGLAWSVPEPVTLPIPAGQFAWHIDVEWIPSRGEYWALFPVKAPGTCVPTALYMATSPDGVAWRTVPVPVLVAGPIPAFRDVVYRSTFAFDARTDEVTFWFSGARFDGLAFTWRTAVQRRPRAEVFAGGVRAARLQLPVAGAAARAAFDPP